MRKKLFQFSKQCLYLLFFFSIMSCGNTIPKSNAYIINDSMPKVAVKDITAAYSDSGYVKLKLLSPLLEDYRDEDEPYVEFKKGVTVFFYDKFQKKTSSLNSNYAKHLTKNDIWEYRDNVKVINEQGDVLTTQQLWVDQEKEKIFSKKEVHIDFADGSEIDGSGGFESNFNFTEYEFKDIEGKINVD